MKRMVGTVARGLRAPIINQGDDLVRIAVETVQAAANIHGFALRDRDVLAITESVVARAQGNYATTDEIAADLMRLAGGKIKKLGLTLPIFSRNRFSVMLSAFAKASKHIVIQLSYPADEVGNHLISTDDINHAGVNPYRDVLDEETFTQLFGESIHIFTGVNYPQLYKKLASEAGADVTLIFANDCREILKHTDTVLTCDVHTRERSKRLLKEAGAHLVLGLDDVLKQPINGSGYNPEYGLLGANMADEHRVKLFPRSCQKVVEEIAASLKEATQKNIDVMIYGDGAFKDPVGGIWELADPVVSPAYTDGLKGKPNELKLKYLADNDFADLSSDDQATAIQHAIQAKTQRTAALMIELSGTTPRQIPDHSAHSAT